MGNQVPDALDKRVGFTAAGTRQDFYAFSVGFANLLTQVGVVWHLATLLFCAHLALLSRLEGLDVSGRGLRFRCCGSDVFCSCFDENIAKIAVYLMSVLNVCAFGERTMHTYISVSFTTAVSPGKGSSHPFGKRHSFKVLSQIARSEERVVHDEPAIDAVFLLPIRRPLSQRRASYIGRCAGNSSQESAQLRRFWEAVHAKVLAPKRQMIEFDKVL
jgi:hypothetical protein